MSEPMEPNVTWCFPGRCQTCDTRRREWDEAQRAKNCPHREEKPSSWPIVQAVVYVVALVAGVGYVVVLTVGSR